MIFFLVRWSWVFAAVLVGRWTSLSRADSALALPATATTAPPPYAAAPLAANADTAVDRAPPREVEGARAKLGQADRVEGDEAPGLVAFTFDDGPAPHTTPKILDALARYHIPATFFVVNRHIVGARGKAGRPLVHRIVADGHLVGGHTASHARLRGLAAPVLRRELDDSLQVLADTAGHSIELFRPPYGDLGRTAGRRLAELGLTDVRWSVDPKDFQSHDGERLRQAVLADLVEEGGGIVLLHDTKHVTAANIDELFADLERLNCRRLARGQAPLLPVSLHYFLRDKGVPRAVPAAVQERTAEYRAYLARTCEERSAARSRPRLEEPADATAPTSHDGADGEVVDEKTERRRAKRAQREQERRRARRERRKRLEAEGTERGAVDLTGI